MEGGWAGACGSFIYRGARTGLRLGRWELFLGLGDLLMDGKEI